jgi:hypothetical protein
VKQKLTKSIFTTAGAYTPPAAKFDHRIRPVIKRWLKQTKDLQPEDITAVVIFAVQSEASFVRAMGLKENPIRSGNGF